MSAFSVPLLTQGRICWTNNETHMFHASSAQRHAQHHPQFDSLFLPVSAMTYTVRCLSVGILPHEKGSLTESLFSAGHEGAPVSRSLQAAERAGRGPRDEAPDLRALRDPLLHRVGSPGNKAFAIPICKKYSHQETSKNNADSYFKSVSEKN